MISEHKLKELERVMEEWIRSGKPRRSTTISLPHPFGDACICYTHDVVYRSYYQIYFYSIPLKVTEIGSIILYHTHDVIQSLRNFDIDLYIAMRAVFHDEPDVALSIAAGVQP